MPRFEATYDVRSKTYAALFRVARHLFDIAKLHKEGSLLNLQAASVFFAFSFEAYLNHVGAEELEFWEEIDRISYSKKLTVLAKHLGFAKKQSEPPLRTMSELFKLRNALAHGRTQELSVKKTTRLPPARSAAWRLLPWEQLTPQSVRRYHDDVRAAINLINSARPKPDSYLWQQSVRGYVIRTIK